MDPKALSAVCSQIYRQYPVLNGVRPRVQARANSLFQISFRGKASTSDGKALPVIVRVTADSSGKIVKTVESH